MPPLRDRRQDIALLVEHFLPQICARIGRTVCEVPASVLRALQSYSWPGNVRQLQNVLEESVIISSGDRLRLPPHFSGTPDGSPGSTDFRSLAEAERTHIRRVLESTGGQVAGSGGAAEILDLHPNTLRSRMKKLGLSVQELGQPRP